MSEGIHEVTLPLLRDYDRPVTKLYNLKTLIDPGSVFLIVDMDDKHIKGSLDAALNNNYDADRYNVSERERETIRNALKDAYLQSHIGYQEPVRQLEIDLLT